MKFTFYQRFQWLNNHGSEVSIHGEFNAKLAGKSKGPFHMAVQVDRNVANELYCVQM